MFSGQIEVSMKIVHNIHTNSSQTFWNDAQGNLTAILHNQIQSYTQANVIKAEGILLQIKNALLEKKDTSLLGDLNDQFYKTIKHKAEGKLNTMKAVSKKFDLCQVAYS